MSSFLENNKVTSNEDMAESSQCRSMTISELIQEIGREAVDEMFRPFQDDQDDGIDGIINAEETRESITVDSKDSNVTNNPASFDSSTIIETIENLFDN